MVCFQSKSHHELFQLIIAADKREKELIKSSKAGILEWQQIIDGKPAILAGTQLYCAVTTVVRFLHVFTSSCGRRVYFSIYFPSFIHQLPIFSLLPRYFHQFPWDLLLPFYTPTNSVNCWH